MELLKHPAMVCNGNIWFQKKLHFFFNLLVSFLFFLYSFLVSSCFVILFNTSLVPYTYVLNKIKKIGGTPVQLKLLNARPI